MRAFQEAAQRSGVPLGVLVGLAWEQSMLSDHGGRPSIDDGFGLLDLSSRRQHDTLAAAARLVHAMPGRLRRDDWLNVMGGALLLAREERSLGYHQLPHAVAAWDRAVVMFTGMRSAFAARLIIADMHRALEHGIHAAGIQLAPMPRIHSSMTWIQHLRSLPSQATETAGPADYPGAVWEPANYNNYTDAKRPSDHRIRYIVIHDTESSCAAAASWFANSASQASAHYLVCLDGTVIQAVHERDIAWHAGNWPINEEAIGIEHEGYSDHAYYTRAQYLASAALVRYLCQKYHLDPNRNVIFGHENVPAADHTDPGPYWNWDFYMRSVRGDAAGYAGGTTSIAMITGNTSIYSCPQASCSPLGSANWGEQFFISRELPGWDAIFYGGQAGWVPSSDIAAGSGNILQVASATSVLSGPKAGDPAVGTVSPGQDYVSLAPDGNFWYIYYNHRYGFIPAGAVRSTTCSPPILGVDEAPLCLLNPGSKLAVTPNTGRPGTPVTVAGTTAAPGSVTVALGGKTIATTQTGPSGTFDITAALPASAAPGGATITATGPNGQAMRTPFVIEPAVSSSPQVSISPVSVTPGSQVTVSGTGFPGEGTVMITGAFGTGNGQKPVVQLAPTGQNGNFAPFHFTIPVGAETGSWTITASAAGLSVRMPITIRAGVPPPSAEATVGAPAASVTPTSTAPVATATPFATTVPAANSPQPALIVSPSVAQPGGNVRIVGIGFAPQSAVTAVVGGIPVTGHTGTLGRFETMFTLPSTMYPGMYFVSGIGPDGSVMARLRVVKQLATSYYFPIGAIGSSPMLSLLNPSDTTGHVSVVYYFRNTHRTKTYVLPAHVDQVLALRRDIGATKPAGLSVTASLPIAARLTGYRSTGGIAAASTTQLLSDWNLPILTPSMGPATIAVLNPGNHAATIQVTPVGHRGSGQISPWSVPPHRATVLTINRSILAGSVAVKVRSTVPVSASWAASSANVPAALDGTQPSPRAWYFPATFTSGPATLQVANSTGSISRLTITLYRLDGSILGAVHHTLGPYHHAVFHPRSAAGAMLLQSSQPIEVGRDVSAASGTSALFDAGTGLAHAAWWFAGEDTRAAVDNILSVFNPGPSTTPLVLRVFTAAGKTSEHIWFLTPHATRQIDLATLAPKSQFGLVLDAASPVIAEQLTSPARQDTAAGYGTPIG